MSEYLNYSVGVEDWTSLAGWQHGLDRRREGPAAGPRAFLRRRGRGGRRAGRRSRDFITLGIAATGNCHSDYREAASKERATTSQSTWPHE